MNKSVEKKVKEVQTPHKPGQKYPFTNHKHRKQPSMATITT